MKLTERITALEAMSKALGTAEKLGRKLHEDGATVEMPVHRISQAKAEVEQLWRDHKAQVSVAKAPSPEPEQPEEESPDKG